MSERPTYQHIIPAELVENPHLVHLGGALMQPGINNDYTIECHGGTTIIKWWNGVSEDDPDIVISVTRLDTGERVALTPKDGVFVDTRRS